MIDNYKKFLKDKTTKNFWKKAKQKEYNRDAVSQILKDLTSNFGYLTTRNSITLRYLGLVINLGSDNLKLSNAGETFIRSPYKQKILDEQIMKIYLNCPSLNDNISINIAPMEIILEIIYNIDYISFDEYKLFVCWVNDKKEIIDVINLIKEYRNTKDKNIFNNTLDEKSIELNISDFSDNVKRFFDMLLISSYLKKESDLIKSNLSKNDIKIILESLSIENFSNENYFDYLTSNNGWQFYTENSNYLKVIKTLEKKTTEEQEYIINNIVGYSKLPDIEKVNPQIISLEIEDKKSISESSIIKKDRKAHKIDFRVRDDNNRTVGDFAEKIILKYEKDYLSNNRSDMTHLIRQVSLEDDSLGYDILSYDLDGKEKHIEVKAVSKKPSTYFRFYISENEIRIAQSDSNYYLYIVFDYTSENPFIYKMPNPFIKNIPGVVIDPIKFLVTVSLKN